MNLFKSTIFLILFIALVSCNDDVFVDRPDAVGEEKIVILDGDGAQTELSYTTKQLECVSLYHIDDCVTTAYSPDGKVLARTSENDYKITEACQLSLANDFISMWIYFDRRGIVSAHAEANAYNHDFTVEVTFDYGQKTQRAVIIVKPGGRYHLADIRYDFSLAVRESVRRQVKLPVVNNNSDTETPVTFSLSPRIPEYFRFDFSGEYAQMLDSSAPDLAPVPTLDASNVPGLFGRGAMFVDKKLQTSDSDLSAEVNAVASPHRRLIITVDVEYSNIKGPFEALVINVSGRMVSFTGEVSVAIPRDFNVVINEEKL